MSTVVNTNVKSLAGQQALTVNQRAMEKSTAQLATGQRINSAADDAAGLAIGNKMTAQIRSLDMAVRNANDGISMLQTADGATSEMTNMLVRMRELAIQSANDTNSQSERDALQSEFLQLQQQTANTVTNTSWNGMKLLKGEAGTANVVKFHVGASSSDSIALPLAELNSNDVAAALATSTAIGSRTNATAAIDLLDKAMVQINGERSRWGAMMNRLTHAADNASNVSMNTSASRSRIMDTDYAQVTAELARSMILNEAGTAMLSQANQQPYYVLALLS
jgi:flagellin